MSTIGRKIWPLQLHGHKPGETMADHIEDAPMVHECESCEQRFIGVDPICCPQCASAAEEIAC